MSSIEVVKLLTLLKTHTEEEIAEYFGITQPAVTYFKQRYDATTDAKIDKIVAILEKENSDVFGANYEDQEQCKPKRFYFKCHDCGFVASEKNIEGILAHIGRHEKKEIKLLTEQTI